MKTLLLHFGICIVFLFNGILTRIEPDFYMKEKMAQVKNMSQLCELMGLQLDDCQAVIDDADASEATDEHGDKVLVTGADDSEIDFAVLDYCNPREQTVYLPENPAFDYTVWPSCTRVMRCGGCTTSGVFACEPTVTEDVFVKVFDTVLPYTGAHRFDIMGVRIVRLEQHVECEAMCRTKEEDCNAFQWYDSRHCTCRCVEEVLELKATCPTTHMWDDSVCGCVCRNMYTRKCKEPSYYNIDTCKCLLKTSVTGEIDFDKLLEQLQSGELNTEILLSGTNNSDSNNIKVSPTEGEDGATMDNSAEGTTSDYDSETQSMPGEGESTVSTTITTSTPSTPSTTTAPKTTTNKKAPAGADNPCEDMACFSIWKGKLRPDGTCACAPPTKS